MLSDARLSVLYDCSTTSKRLPVDFADDRKDLKTIIKYGELFKVCHAIHSSDYIQKAENLEEEERETLKKIVDEKLKKAEENEEKIEWNVNIVVGNSHVAKSLRPVINIRMPDGKLLEFDIDSFAQFRQQLATAVLAVNPQE
uniref:COMM domain-containing protein n=1 Tax=Caenorhabditis japonica TaxID=281687 RepID=A0A8R1DMZ8_CAEJA